jgi:hypothetical protein
MILRFSQFVERLGRYYTNFTYTTIQPLHIFSWGFFSQRDHNSEASRRDYHRSEATEQRQQGGAVLKELGVMANRSSTETEPIAEQERRRSTTRGPICQARRKGGCRSCSTDMKYLLPSTTEAGELLMVGPTASRVPGHACGNNLDRAWIREFAWESSRRCRVRRLDGKREHAETR